MRVFFAFTFGEDLAFTFEEESSCACFFAFTFGEDLAFAFEEDLTFTFEEVGL